jgi:hypothetical protein
MQGCALVSDDLSLLPVLLLLLLEQRLRAAHVLQA